MLISVSLDEHFFSSAYAYAYAYVAEPELCVKTRLKSVLQTVRPLRGSDYVEMAVRSLVREVKTVFSIIFLLLNTLTLK